MKDVDLLIILTRLAAVLLPLVGVAIAFIIGALIEQRHLRRLGVAESALADIMYCDLKRFPNNWQPTAPHLVCGQVVIANDRFKTWLASWINLFGGRIKCYESLLDRARREAIVRMLLQARLQNANAVWNVRIETTAIQGKTQAAGVEIMAYGTAVHVENDR